MQLKITQNNIFITQLFVFVLFAVCSCDNKSQPEIAPDYKRKLLDTRMFKNKEGEIIKTELCNYCDTSNGNFSSVSKYYAQNRLILVEKKTGKELSVFYIDYDGKDSSIRYECGYYIFHEYFNSSGITGFENPYTELKEYIATKGQKQFAAYVEMFLLENFKIKITDNAVDNLIHYLNPSVPE